MNLTSIFMVIFAILLGALISSIVYKLERLGNTLPAGARGILQAIKIDFVVLLALVIVFVYLYG